MMGSSAFSIALTICLLGSSAAGYVFGVISNSKRSQTLQNTMHEWLSDPNRYQTARKNHLQKSNGQYAIHR